MSAELARLRAALAPAMRHLINHTGLFRCEAVRRIGGYYGGFRIGYDTLLVNLLRMTARITYVERPLYHRRLRDGSLTRSGATGLGSVERRRVAEALGQIYRQALTCTRSYHEGALTLETLSKRIRALCLAGVGNGQRAALGIEAERLRRLLDDQPCTRGARVL